MSPRQQMVSPAAQRIDSGLTGPLVFVDADNTLWDTDGVFARAQLTLLSLVEEASGQQSRVEDRLNYIRAFDQALAEQHHLGLRYPPRLLIQALALAQQGLSQREAVRRAWSDGSQSGLAAGMISQIENTYIELISRPPELLYGVLTGLRALALVGATTVVLTEGSRKRVMRTIEHHDFVDYIDRVFEAPKTARMFQRVRSLARAGQTVYMIGDQLTRDIRPASEAGLTTIYIPGAFQPKWERQTGNIAALQASTFDEAAALVIGVEKDARSPQPAGGEQGYLRFQNKT